MHYLAVLHYFHVDTSVCVDGTALILNNTNETTVVDVNMRINTAHFKVFLVRSVIFHS